MTELENEPKQHSTQRTSYFNRALELYIWIFIPFIIAFRPILFSYTFSYAANDILLNHYTEIFCAVLAFLFPYLFKLIFDAYPFEYLRNRKNNLRESVTETFDKIGTFIKETADISAEVEINDNFKANEKVYRQEQYIIQETHLLELYLMKSEKVADKIYSRGGVYLLIGCLIAFGGVLFFYFQSIALHAVIKIDSKDFDYSKLFLEYLPRLGTLIFVEAVAFFFLRQYRQTMEEFRYYEAIKRQRENQFAIFKLVKDYTDKPEIYDKLINYCAFNENPNKLIQGESTAIIEADKVITKDNEIFDKLIELVKISKK